MHIILNILTQNKLPAGILNSTKPESILLMREAIYLALVSFPANMPNHNIYLLEDDWLARCGTLNPIIKNITLVNAAQFAELCCNHDVIVTW